MTRRLLSTALLGYLALATWMLTARFTAWGDDLAGTIAGAWAEPPPPAPAAGGIDFVECFGCDALPGAQGFGLVFLLLVVSGGPLALAAAALGRCGVDARSRAARWWQAAFVVQLASVAAGAVVLYGMLHLAPSLADALHWLTGCAFLDVVAGAPALVLWRRLQPHTAAQPFRAVFQ